jgi:signal transduction histidine kinase
LSVALCDPAVLEAALRQLEEHGRGLMDWAEPTIHPIYHASLTYARLAAHLAERTSRCDPELAWVTGLLAPLGWLAVCTVAPAQAGACLNDPQFAQSPRQTQHHRWGLNQEAIARRLARFWQLPRWLAAITGHLRLPVETVQALGGDVDLFRVTQLAIGLAQEQGIALGLEVGTAPEAMAAALGLTAEDRQAVWREARLLVEESPPAREAPPADLQLLPELLGLAAENRRLHGIPLLDRLADDLDQLHRALEEQHAGEAERLQTLKLNALAELAAGAGHEINNPLAVISGQAQYLLGHEPEPERQRALHAIISQAQRIYEILSDLMQFARPSRPQKQHLDVASLVRDVVGSLSELAIRRRVQLLCPETHGPLTLYADLRQMRTALTCLLRNAIEAAPAGGWAGVRVELRTPGCLDLVVEDSGTGPAPAQREHLFDPFFSGREAGRGRGLGLPTAWRLAREHGGEVHFDDLPRGPTRFVLSLPCPVVNGQVPAATTIVTLAGRNPPEDDRAPALCALPSDNGAQPAQYAGAGTGHTEEMASSTSTRDNNAGLPWSAKSSGASG